MTELIRIEHSESGVGIFRHKFSEWEYLKKFYDRHNDLPSPTSDKETEQMRNVFKHAKLKAAFHNVDNNWLCAYKSLEQLLEWVLVEEFSLIISAGFKFYLIKTESYITGNFQSIYRKENIIEKTDITSLFETYGNN